MYSLKRKEILKDSKTIKLLIYNARKTYYYPILAKWELFFEDNCLENVQVGFSVSKNKFHNAVVRNTIKRRMKEAYRQNKYILQNVNKNLQLKFFFIYTSSVDENFSVINKAIIYILNSINNFYKL